MKSFLNLFSKPSFGLINVDHIQSKLCAEKLQTLKVMNAVKPYFLSPYKEQGFLSKAARQIDGRVYVVNRFNHGLAHSLRQGALAKDILEVINSMKTKYGVLDHPELDKMADWIHSQTSIDKKFVSKVEFAASFQRSGRQSEVSSFHDMKKYKQYEQQDLINFRNAAHCSGLYRDEQEIKIFEEAILWENRGELDENSHVDLKFLRRILHVAHTLDLRRIPSFNAHRIQSDSIQQLLGIKFSIRTVHINEIQRTLWGRSGDYLEATGDRDLIQRPKLKNIFFYQSTNPNVMVDAIHKVRGRAINIS